MERLLSITLHVAIITGEIIFIAAGILFTECQGVMDTSLDTNCSKSNSCTDNSTTDSTTLILIICLSVVVVTVTVVICYCLRRKGVGLLKTCSQKAAQTAAPEQQDDDFRDVSATVSDDVTNLEVHQQAVSDDEEDDNMEYIYADDKQVRTLVDWKRAQPHTYSNVNQDGRNGVNAHGVRTAKKKPDDEKTKTATDRRSDSEDDDSQEYVNPDLEYAPPSSGHKNILDNRKADERETIIEHEYFDPKRSHSSMSRDVENTLGDDTEPPSCDNLDYDYAYCHQVLGSLELRRPGTHPTSPRDLENTLASTDSKEQKVAGDLKYLSKQHSHEMSGLDEKPLVSRRIRPYENIHRPFKISDPPLLKTALAQTESDEDDGDKYIGPSPPPRDLTYDYAYGHQLRGPGSAKPGEPYSRSPADPTMPKSPRPMDKPRVFPRAKHGENIENSRFEIGPRARSEPERDQRCVYEVVALEM